MNKQSISLKKREKYYSRGKWYVLFDHLFVIFIFFRMNLINSSFYNSIFASRPRLISIKLKYLFVFPVPTFLIFVILFCIFLQRYPPIKEKIMDWKTTRVWSLIASALPIAIAFLFSLLFINKLEELIVEFPEQYQDGVIPAYYLSYIYAFMYFAVRALFAFDYYQSFYYKYNRDLLYPLAIAYIFITLILTAFFPREWYYILY